jgi:hypothetical protein
MARAILSLSLRVIIVTVIGTVIGGAAGRFVSFFMVQRGCFAEKASIRP